MGNKISVGLRGLHFKVADYIDLCSFLMAPLKRSWQYWHSCIVENL